MFKVLNRHYLIIFSYLLMMIACSPQTAKAQANAFLKEITNPNPNYEQIISKYLCKAPDNEAAKQIINLQLDALSKRLTGKNYEVKRYNVENNLLIVDPKSKNEIFEIVEDSKLVTYVIINEKNKIISFSAMNKGKHMIPMLICHD